MNYRIKGTVKAEFHTYGIDLTVEAVEPEQAKPVGVTPENFLTRDLMCELTPTTYTVEYQRTLGKTWKKSDLWVTENPFDSFAAAEKALHELRAKSLNYRIVTSDGLIVPFDAPKETPSTFIVEFESQQGQWVRSGNTGLTDRFATRAEAIAAIVEFGNTDALEYRVTEVQA